LRGHKLPIDKRLYNHRFSHFVKILFSLKIGARLRRAAASFLEIKEAKERFPASSACFQPAQIYISLKMTARSG
jgi:hypothetical protein